MKNLNQTIEPDWEMSSSDWLAVVGASLGAFMAILDIQITNASLTELQGSLSLDFSEGGWISTSYLMAEITVIPLTSFFSKVFGLRRYFLWNCFFFIISSMLCGLAWNFPTLISARVLQGLSGGTLIPLAFQIMMLYMPPHRKNMGLVIFGTIATLAPTLGPTLGGWLTENYSWRSIFLINFFPGLLTMTAIRMGLPNAKPMLNKLKNFDFGGMISLTLALSALTYLLEDGAKMEWFDDNHIRFAFLICLISFPVFITIQLLHKNPLLNIKLLKNRNFSFAALITMLAAAALYGGVYSLSLYLGQIQGYSAQNIGKVMMWIGIPQLAVMPFIPYLLRKFDGRILAVFGLGLFAFSNFLNTKLTADYGGDQFTLSLIIRALGQPLFIIPLSSIGMANVTPLEVGNASSIYNVLRNLGGSFGIALAGTFAISRESFHFNRIIENVQLTTQHVVETLRSIEYYLMSQGVDSQESKTLAKTILVSITHKQSMIKAFSDIFTILFLGLVVSAFLVMVLKKNRSSGENSALH